MCVRPAWDAEVNTCQGLKPECNCLPYLKKAWKGNVWLAADGYRYNLQQVPAAIGLARILKLVIRSSARVPDHWVYLFNVHLQTGLDGARSSNPAGVEVASLGRASRRRIHVHA